MPSGKVGVPNLRLLVDVPWIAGSPIPQAVANQGGGG